MKAIVTVPTDISCKFVLVGYYPRSPDKAVVVHIDFSLLIR